MSGSTVRLIQSPGSNRSTKIIELAENRVLGLRSKASYLTLTVIWAFVNVRPIAEGACRPESCSRIEICPQDGSLRGNNTIDKSLPIEMQLRGARQVELSQAAITTSEEES